MEEPRLAAEPNTGENCVHASASPFEGLAERMNWLGYRADRDQFGKALLAAGVSLKTIKDWTLDPAVTYGPKLNPTTKSIWDTIEDMDSEECCNKCAEIAAWKPLRKAKFGKVAKIKPEQKGVNLMLKCVSGPTAVEGQDGLKEVSAGDETGTLILSMTNEQVGPCKDGACIRVQNAHVKMIKGFMRLVVDKWTNVAGADSVEFESVDEKNNVSKVEFELA